MPIDAKRNDADGSVTTIPLPDDPSDNDLTTALGSKGGVVTLGEVRGWEVLVTSKDGGNALVVGQPPYLGVHPKRRLSCTLSDQQATELVKRIREVWHLLGENIQ